MTGHAPDTFPVVPYEGTRRSQPSYTVHTPNTTVKYDCESYFLILYPPKVEAWQNVTACSHQSSLVIFPQSQNTQSVVVKVSQNLAVCEQNESASLGVYLWYMDVHRCVRKLKLQLRRRMIELTVSMEGMIQLWRGFGSRMMGVEWLGCLRQVVILGLHSLFVGCENML